MLLPSSGKNYENYIVDLLGCVSVESNRPKIKGFIYIFNFLLDSGGYAVAQLIEALCCKSEGRGFDPRHWNFSFRPHCVPWVDSASNRNEYQEYFLGSKDCRCVGLTT